MTEVSVVYALSPTFLGEIDPRWVKTGLEQASCARQRVSLEQVTRCAARHVRAARMHYKRILNVCSCSALAIAAKGCNVSPALDAGQFCGASAAF